MKNPNILIIGGGIAGLSAGIYAQKNGFQATILEMPDKPGGQLTAWERNGYHFDYCLHWLVGTDHGTYNHIWKETDVLRDDVKVINQHEYVRMVDEKGDFMIYNDLDHWENYLKEFAPEDTKAIHKMCNLMRQGDRLDPFEDAPGSRSLFDYFSAMFHIGSFFGVLYKYGKRTCQELFEELGFQNKRLLFFLNKIFGSTDFSAIGFIVMFGWFHAKNAGYLEGGSLEMARRMAHKFRVLGGEFKYKSKVKEILVENDTAVGVKLENDEVLHADHVISACDGHTVLYQMLGGNYLSDSLKDAYQNWKLFNPVVMVSFGIQDKIISACHMTNYLVSDFKIGSTPVGQYSIMNRSMYDSSFAPEGKSVLLMMFESPWENWEHLQGVAYLDEKEQIRKNAVALLEKHYPGISSKIEVIDIATPQTTARYTGVWKGAYEGFMPDRDTMLKELPMKLPGLKNFTMIGQWLFPGGGLPPSAQSGKWAIQMLCKEKHKAFEA